MSKRLIATLAAALVLVAVLVVLLPGGLAGAKDFDTTDQAFKFLKERPRCKTFACLNQRVNRLEFLIRDLVRTEFVCTEIAPPDDSGREYLYNIC